MIPDRLAPAKRRQNQGCKIRTGHSYSFAVTASVETRLLMIDFFYRKSASGREARLVCAVRVQNGTGSTPLIGRPRYACSHSGAPGTTAVVPGAVQGRLGMRSRDNTHYRRNVSSRLVVKGNESFAGSMIRASRSYQSVRARDVISSTQRWRASSIP
jgi:hypothetical protein